MSSNVCPTNDESEGTTPTTFNNVSNGTKTLDDVFVFVVFVVFVVLLGVLF